MEPWWRPALISAATSLSSRPVVTISDTVNNPGDIIVQGIELQSQVDILKTFAIAARGWRWSAFTNAYYHFNMVDRGAPVAAGSARPVRIYEYEAAIGTRFGQSGSGVPWRDWNLQIIGNLRGPMWYNTEERLLLPGQLVNVTVYRKSPFWVWNTRYEVENPDSDRTMILDPAKAKAEPYVWQF